LHQHTLTGDLFMSADAAVNQTLMGEQNGNRVPWFVVFARNEVVLVYSQSYPNHPIASRSTRCGLAAPLPLHTHSDLGGRRYQRYAGTTQDRDHGHLPQPLTKHQLSEAITAQA
jgi:hypothetical protein